jgi:hypothetical protein
LGGRSYDFFFSYINIYGSIEIIKGTRGCLNWIQLGCLVSYVLLQALHIFVVASIFSGDWGISNQGLS